MSNISKSFFQNNISKLIHAFRMHTRPGLQASGLLARRLLLLFLLQQVALHFCLVWKEI